MDTPNFGIKRHGIKDQSGNLSGRGQVTALIRVHYEFGGEFFKVGLGSRLVIWVAYLDQFPSFRTGRNRT